MISSHDFCLDSTIAENTEFIIDLDLCKVLLQKDQRFPWLILVPKIENIVELYDLSREDQTQLAFEVSHISALFKKEMHAEKINIAALGNIVPQFHIHIVARYSYDSAWPNPVWGLGIPVPYHTDRLSEMVEKLKSLFAALCKK